MNLSTIKKIQTNGKFISKITRQDDTVLWKEQELVTYRYKTNDYHHICSDYVPYGESGTYPSMPQEIEEPAGTKWSKGNWDENINHVTSDITATLSYNKTEFHTIDYYTATDYRELLSSQSVLHGGDGTIPEHEEKLRGSDGEWWFYDKINKSITNVQEDLTVDLVYVKKYTVTFEEFASNPGQATVISTDYYTPGSRVIYPEHSFIQYHTFDKWEPESIPSIDKTQEVVAKYIKNSINVTSENSYLYEEGKTFCFDLMATCNNNPERSIGDGITALYSENEQGPFSEQKISSDQPNTDKTVYFKVNSDNYPQYESSGRLIVADNLKKVTFSYYDENDIEKTTITQVQYGGTPNFPDIQERKMYLHDGWDYDGKPVTTDLTVTENVSMRPYHNTVWSQLSITNVDVTCYLSGNVYKDLTAVCDWEDHEQYIDRDINDYWYEYDSYGTKAIVGLEQLSCLQRDRAVIDTENRCGYGFTIYPHFFRNYYLSVFCVSSETVPLTTYTVISGNSRISDTIDLPDIDKWSFDHWNPSEWNPVNSDKSLSAVYIRNTVTITVESNGNGKVSIDDSEPQETISKEVDIGTTVSIKAVGNEGYEFSKWGDENTDNPRTVIVEDDCRYTALFEELNVLRTNENEYLKTDDGYLLEYS